MFRGRQQTNDRRRGSAGTTDNRKQRINIIAAGPTGENHCIKCRHRTVEISTRDATSDRTMA
jgi:hypothetical protein